jgi:glycerol-3-phosphate acyltransferase PlsX
MSKKRIALDVMGGDHAPEATLRGVQLALAPGPRQVPAERLLLVGDRSTIEAWFARNGGNPGCELRHAAQVIGMGESPSAALRSKPDNSISSSVGAVREGLAGAALSMGNTGACVGAATLGMGTLSGVRRPGIAITMSVRGKPLVLLDMGANVSPKPEHFVQYGLMGRAFAQSCLGIAEPRVGLLNVGEEPGKGSDLCKESFPLLAASGLHFVGNVEGNDLFRERADVIVTDGFTGNVVLKLMEEFAGFMLERVREELEQRGASWAREALGVVRKQFDYAEYGGALLLGVQGIMVVGHGRSDARAIANALWQGGRALDTGVNEAIVASLATAQRPDAAGAGT